MSERTWTNHTATCRGCLQHFRISREAIADFRSEAAAVKDESVKSLSDEQIASRFDLCLHCATGIDNPEGEIISQAQKDQIDAMPREAAFIDLAIDNVKGAARIDAQMQERIRAERGSEYEGLEGLPSFPAYDANVHGSFSAFCNAREAFFAKQGAR